MLRSLYIENIAVARRMSVDFSNGFTVITGETGAGKSVMIDALSLISGGKSAREMIRNGEDSALVSAVFSDVTPSPLLAEAGITPDENGDIEIRRTLTADGRSTVKIGGRTVPISLLREIAPALLSIQSQSESRNLLDASFHLQMLDEYADTESVLEEYRGVYSRFTTLRTSLESLKNSLREKNMLTDILRYQLKEIDSAKLSDPNEDEKLTVLRTKIKNIERIQKYSGFVYHALAQNDKGASAAVLLQKSAQALRQLADVMPEAEELAARLDGYRYEIADIGETVYAMLADGEVTNPEAQLNTLEARLSQIERLKRKYGETIADILSFRKETAAKLSDMESGEEKIAEIESEILSVRRTLAGITSRIHDKRAAAAEKIGQLISETLAYLDMPKVRFVADVRRQFDASGEELFGPCGSDEVTFLIATNPGEPPMPLGKIASGGEMSRVMLALQSVLNSKNGAQTVVFDEIDAGVSGGTSEKIGLKLKEISQAVQVLCVTHSPQIASLADTHLRIVKTVTDGRAESSVETLDADGRVAEIARIIGGVSVTETQRDAAREMIQNNTQ
ncbi:MAG: DNA repair protein RecN [Clostridia bacterium]|nr:DNA repair protein RecN [Clostridia bacterium]